MAAMKRVQFVLQAPAARAVNVAGTFNNWKADQYPLRKGKDGLWRTDVRVPAGRHEYRFIVDGQWMSDPKAAESQPNAYGSTNSVLRA
jgi:1,4-alpha-glucan branching enzyme